MRIENNKIHADTKEEFIEAYEYALNNEQNTTIVLFRKTGETIFSFVGREELREKRLSIEKELKGYPYRYGARYYHLKNRLKNLKKRLDKPHIFLNKAKKIAVKHLLK